MVRLFAVALLGLAVLFGAAQQARSLVIGVDMGTEFMKVAALAQANDLDIAPHGAQEVHIHLVSAIPNGLILEYYRDSVNPMYGKVWEHELTIEDGYVYAPDLPGLGLTPKWGTLAPYRVG